MKRTKEKKKEEEEMELIMKVKDMLENKQHVKEGTWSAKEVDLLNKHLFLTSKPVVFLVNIGRDQYIKQKNPWLPKIQEYINQNGGGPMIPYSAEFESEVVAEAKDDRDAQAAKAKELGAPSKIDRIIKAGYRHL